MLSTAIFTFFPEIENFQFFKNTQIFVKKIILRKLYHFRRIWWQSFHFFPILEKTEFSSKSTNIFFKETFFHMFRRNVTISFAFYGKFALI